MLWNVKRSALDVALKTIQLIVLLVLLAWGLTVVEDEDQYRRRALSHPFTVHSSYALNFSSSLEAGATYNFMAI